MSYKLKLDLFEGPLDLLLYLIRKNDIDIHDIPIAKVAQQYIEYIEMMKMVDLDLIGDFLVMAATLMQIKSRMLLPPDPEEVTGPQEDPRDELVRRLQEYQQFKEIAETLKQRESLRQELFNRQLDPEKLKQLKEDSKEIFFEANLFDLISAFTEALNRAPEEVIHEIIKEEHTVEKKIHEILHLLLDQSQVMVNDIFKRCREKSEVIVTFLAVLELIRLKEIKAFQRSVFGEIEVVRNKDNMVPAQEPETPSESSAEQSNQGEAEN